MKPILVLALGNSLAGDDGVGAQVIARLADDAAVNDVADLVAGGSDLFRCADLLRQRRHVILVDAALSTGDLAAVQLLNHPPGSEYRRTHAHDLDPVAALELLRRTDDQVASADTEWLLLDVPRISVGEGISAAAVAAVELAVARIRAHLVTISPPA